MKLTIVSTSLITIANDLGDFSKSSWIIEGYLLTYFVRPGPPIPPSTTRHDKVAYEKAGVPHYLEQIQRYIRA
jgi:hypothetical protein